MANMFKGIFNRISLRQKPVEKFKKEKEEHVSLPKTARKTQRRSRKLSPYTVKPALQKVVIRQLSDFIEKNRSRFRTDKHTLFEIVDEILTKEIHFPRPAELKAHTVFESFCRTDTRIRPGVKQPCHEWAGTYQKGIPVLSTLNAIHGHRLVVDARKYIIENPKSGKRRNLRSKPQNICGNPKCVNPAHIKMVGLEREEKVGENHGRAKFSDKHLLNFIREYNSGKTAKSLISKYGMTLQYAQMIVRKKARKDLTEKLKIRSRFGAK